MAKDQQGSGYLKPPKFLFFGFLVPKNFLVIILSWSWGLGLEYDHFYNNFVLTNMHTTVFSQISLLHSNTFLYLYVLPILYPVMVVVHKQRRLKAEGDTPE